jgi:GNAT superfamily N-acetyltransferase
METTLRSPTDDDQKALIWFMEKAYRQAYFPLMSETARSAFPEGTWLRDWPRVMHRESGTISVLAERSGQIVGFAQTVVARNGEMGTVLSARDRELRFLYVDPSQQGSGLARRLLQAVLDDDEPAELWVVESNSRAISFYRKNGFTPDGARFALSDAEPHAEGISEIRMVR